MASPARSLSDNTIKLEYGVSETLCFRFIEGKNLGKSEFPPFAIRVRFSTQDDRSLFLDAEDASDLERGLRNAGVDPRQGDFVRVTKIRHPRGGGHSIRVERVDDDGPNPDPPARHDREQPRRASREEALLEKSVELARTRGAGAFITRREPETESRTASGPRHEHHVSQPTRQPTNNTAAPASAKGTMTGLVAGALIASIDAYIAAAEYGKSKGIAVDLRLDFNAEDIRQSATAMLIEYWRSGGTR